MIVECEDCHAIVDAELVADFVDVSEEEGAAGKYSFLKCPKCHRPFVMLEVDFGAGWESPQRLYPPREASLDLSIPAPIRSILEEGTACFKAKAYTATAIMCRKTIEAIAKESGVAARNLDTALTSMRDKGIIERRLYDWADALRMLGNVAAHDMDAKVTPQDARDILDFTTALLEYVFTFQKRFEGFMARRKEGHGA
jgi:hypothetical protein